MALLKCQDGVAPTAESQSGCCAAVQPVEADLILDVAQGDVDEVVANAGEIEGFDRAEARGVVGVAGGLVRDEVEVERQASTIEGNGVEARAAIDTGELIGVAAGTERGLQGSKVGSVEHEAIVAGAARHHI